MRIRAWHRHMLFALAGVLRLAGSAAGAIVYDNLTHRTGVVVELLGPGETNSPELGNSLTLAGSERAVTELQYRLRIFGAGPAIFNSRIRFYANDGAAGAPGTLLWDSGSRAQVTDSGADVTFYASVPNVVVPSSFTWTIQLTNRQYNMSLFGPPTFDPPTVGSAPYGFWQNGGGGWFYAGTGYAPFGARVTAVPAPRRPGDANCDGALNNFDIDPFVLALTNAAGYMQAFPNCNVNNADVNNDGQINNFDIDPFVACLTAGACP